MYTAPLYRGLILLAGLLLSLHSVVPHVHKEHHFSAKEIIASSVPGPSADLFELLRDLFTDTDLGEDHLEHFSVDQDTTVDMELAPCSPLVVLTNLALPATAVQVWRHQRLSQDRHFPPAGVYPDSTAPRGPPSLA